jgi:hypothetical protein
VLESGCKYDDDQSLRFLRRDGAVLADSAPCPGSDIKSIPGFIMI